MSTELVVCNTGVSQPVYKNQKSKSNHYIAHGSSSGNRLAVLDRNPSVRIWNGFVFVPSEQRKDVMGT